MLRRIPATTAKNVDLAAVGPLANEAGGCVRKLVIFAQLIRQARIGISHQKRICDAGQQLHMRAQLISAEAAIEANCHWLCVPHRIPECLYRVPRQVASGQVCQRERNHQRYVFAALCLQLFHRHDRGFAVERVEHRLDQDKVRAAFDQCSGLFTVNVLHFIKGDFAKARVFDIG